MGAYFYSDWIFRVGANPVTHFHKVYFVFYLQKEETSLLSLHTGIYALIFGEGGGGVIIFSWPSGWALFEVGRLFDFYYDSAS